MNRTISWPDKSLPMEIYCAPGILHGLEMAAVDGLLAMPRTGLGIGGLLLGQRVNKGIRIERALAIPCSHALGPSFVLTPEEMDEAAGWPTRADGSYAGCELVGCYWSKPNGSFTLTGYDQVLYQMLCGEPWQTALLIRPILGNVTTAAFGFHGGDNKFQLGSPQQLMSEEAGESALESPESLQSEVPERVVTVVEKAPEVVREEVVPAPPVLRVPTFGVSQRVHKANKSRQWLLRALAIAVLLAVLAATAFFARANDVARGSYLPESGISK